MGITITEALAEIKTINKRLASKRQFVLTFLFRQDGLRDPLEKDGGSVEVIKREQQSIADLERRVVTLRRGIQMANDATPLAINGVTLTIAEWLNWRRDVAPDSRSFLSSLRQKIDAMRVQAHRQGASMLSPGAQAERPSDIMVNISENDLAKDIERFETTLGELDGLLSLKNATVQIQSGE